MKDIDFAKLYITQWEKHYEATGKGSADDARKWLLTATEFTNGKNQKKILTEINNRLIGIK